MAKRVLIDPPNHDDIDSHSAGPDRKRVRAEMTSEERKKARIINNRISAKKSRERKRMEFADLERRVAELEEENRLLRAFSSTTETNALKLGSRNRLEEDRVRAEQDQARERENKELRERIRTLESAVPKGLATQELPSDLPSFVSQSTPESTCSAPNNTETSSIVESIPKVTSILEIASNPSPPFSLETTQTRLVHANSGHRTGAVEEPGHVGRESPFWRWLSNLSLLF